MNNIQQIESLCDICFPDKQENDPRYIEGNLLRRRWVKENIKRYGSVGKIALDKSGPVGLIQYLPRPEDKIVDIMCFFVTEGDSTREDVAKKLIEETIKGFKRSKSFFSGSMARALVAYDQPSSDDGLDTLSFEDHGFKKGTNTDRDFWYYPIDEDYVHENEQFKVEKGDLNKVLLFYGSYCPLCVYRMEKAMMKIREVSPELPVKIMIGSEEEKRLSSSRHIGVINNYQFELDTIEEDTLKLKIKEVMINEPTEVKDR